MRKNIGDKGIIGRIGGDEFICLFTDCHSEDDVRIYLKAIRKGLSFSLAEKQPDMNSEHRLVLQSIRRMARYMKNYSVLQMDAFILQKKKGRTDI